jgi:hypothetical protein
MLIYNRTFNILYVIISSPWINKETTHDFVKDCGVGIIDDAAIGSMTPPNQALHYKNPTWIFIIAVVNS